MTIYAAIPADAEAMRAAQRAFDNRQPDDSEPWLETTDGANWLHDQANALRHGHDLRIGGKVAVRYRAFLAEFSQRLGELMAEDWDFELEQALAAGRPPRTTHFEKLAQKVAEEMIAPHAEAALEQLRREAEEP